MINVLFICQCCHVWFGREDADLGRFFFSRFNLKAVRMGHELKSSARA